MKLKDYLEKEDMSAREFAKLIGLHYETIYGYTAGKYSPSLGVAQMIIDLSNGEVTMQDLVDTKRAPCCPTCGRVIGRGRIKKKPIADKIN